MTIDIVTSLADSGHGSLRAVLADAQPGDTITFATALAGACDCLECAMIGGMATAVPLDPVLKDFRDAVAKLYGPALDRVVLFGSRARGEAREDSDYDVAVFLKEMPDRWAEWDRLTRLAIPFMDEGAYIQVVPFRASDFEKRTPIMHEIRKDGLTL